MWCVVAALAGAGDLQIATGITPGGGIGRPVLSAGVEGGVTSGRGWRLGIEGALGRPIRQADPEGLAAGPTEGFVEQRERGTLWVGRRFDAVVDGAVSGRFTLGFDLGGGMLATRSTLLGWTRAGDPAGGVSHVSHRAAVGSLRVSGLLPMGDRLGVTTSARLDGWTQRDPVTTADAPVLGRRAVGRFTLNIALTLRSPKRAAEPVEPS